MTKSKWRVLSVAIPLSVGLSLSLVACGSDSDGNGNTGGASSGGTASTGGTESSTAGSSSKAGSSGSSSSSAGSSSSSAGTSSSGGTTQSGGGNLPGSKPLNELTEDEVDALCEDFSERFSGDDVSETLCRFNGVLAALVATSDEQAQQLCKSTYDQCKASPTETTESCEQPGEDCTATVNELNACLDAFTETFGSLKDSLPSCDGLTTAEVVTVLGQLGTLEDPEACTTFSEKCEDGPAPPTPGFDTP